MRDYFSRFPTFAGYGKFMGFMYGFDNFVRNGAGVSIVADYFR
jgi:hypothetical protein